MNDPLGMPLPFALAGVTTALLVLLAVTAVVLGWVARKQLAIRWQRVFAEPADARRVRGDLGETQAHAALRDVLDAEPGLGLRVFPGRRVPPFEIDQLVLTRAALWVVEVKAWRGRLAAGADGWVAWHTSRRGIPSQQRRGNPVKQAQRQARALSRWLAGADLGGVPVRELVVFSDPEVDLDAVREEGFVLYLDELHGFFTVGQGTQGTPLDEDLRARVAAAVERLPAWDFLVLAGGGRRGRLVTEQLELRTPTGRRTVALADVREARFRLRGWPWQRVDVELTAAEGAIAGVAADPTARLWLREPDGQVHPYPLCVLRGMVRGAG